LLSPNAWKDAWGLPRPDPASCRKGHHSNSWLLTPGFCIKNEGASGDMYESKETEKCGRATCQGNYLEAQKPEAWGA
jgi:hypothetical protein